MLLHIHACIYVQTNSYGNHVQGLIKNAKCHVVEYTHSVEDFPDQVQCKQLVLLLE